MDCFEVEDGIDYITSHHPCFENAFSDFHDQNYMHDDNSFHFQIPDHALLNNQPVPENENLKFEDHQNLPHQEQSDRTNSPSPQRDALLDDVQLNQLSTPPQENSPIMDESSQLSTHLVQHHRPVQRMSAKEKALQRKKAIQKKNNIEEVPEDDGNDDSDKKKQQKIKNRISAQRSRDTKKLEFTELKEKVNELVQCIQQLQIEKSDLLNQLEQRGICSRCRQESTNDTISDLSSSDEQFSTEYVRHSKGGNNQSFAGFSFSPMSVMIVICLVLCASLSTSITVDPSQGNSSFPQLSTTASAAARTSQASLLSPLMLNQVPHSGLSPSEQICECNSTSTVEDSMISRLISMNGIDKDSLNYGTKIIDSRANRYHHNNQLAIQGYNNLRDFDSEFESDSEQNTDSYRPKIMIDPNSKNDQIYCADPTIFLNSLSDNQLKLEGKHFIDLVYSTGNAKSFIQFGDQYFQTKPDGSNKYVQLTCKVVSYFSGELEE